MGEVGSVRRRTPSKLGCYSWKSPCSLGAPREEEEEEGVKEEAEGVGVRWMSAKDETKEEEERRLRDVASGEALKSVPGVKVLGRGGRWAETERKIDRKKNRN